MESKETNKVQLTNTMALVGFVMSFFHPTMGLIFSIIGMCQIKNTNEPAKGFALAGIIISAVMLLLVILLYVFIFMMAFLGEMSYYY
jgi:high-affinity nickel permease